MHTVSCCFVVVFALVALPLFLPLLRLSCGGGRCHHPMVGKIVVVPNEGRRGWCWLHCRCHHCVHCPTIVVLPLLLSLLQLLCGVHRCLHFCCQHLMLIGVIAWEEEGVASGRCRWRDSHRFKWGRREGYWLALSSHSLHSLLYWHCCCHYCGCGCFLLSSFCAQVLLH